ncbi:MAG: ClbS/DfsB family four-helix bundle protein [Dinoroseobacter sp.]|nr:ClbS/DfsB family four-helix bundle protein [Dinoroseobacter sp.]
MPAASTKAELLDICEKEFAKLTRTLDTIDGELALVPGPDGASIKDTVAHRAHWIDLYLSWVRAGRAGHEVQTPAPGYKWNQLKAYNAQLREAQAELSWGQARSELSDAHGRLMAFLTDEDDVSLYTPHLMPWMNNWTLGRWAEASGASHYRSANTYIRKLSRALATDR